MPQQRYTGVPAGAAGTVTIVVTTRGAQIMVVSQVSAELTKGTATAVGPAATGMLRLNGAPVAPFVAGADAIAGDPPVEVAPGDELTIEWTGLNAGNIGQALVFYTYRPAS
jgi:hypothetical protein